MTVLCLKLLYTSKSLLAHPGINWIEHLMNPSDSRGARRTLRMALYESWFKAPPMVSTSTVFQVEYVTFLLTLLHLNVGPPKSGRAKKAAVQERLFAGPLRTFWLLPQTIEGSAVALSIEEKQHPSGDGIAVTTRSYGIRLTDETRGPRLRRTGTWRPYHGRSGPYSRVQAATKDTEFGRKRLETAVVAFGSRRDEFRIRGWCSLANGDVVSDLESYYASNLDVPILDPKGVSSLDLGSGFLLKASVVEPYISDEPFMLVEVWVATLDNENKAVVDGGKDVVSEEGCGHGWAS
ncbi:hypothetical protein N657DRAFT_273784 [Parathielavia appendiculata]|uniref:Uncharacterized protein n=1 Tax=Parathielavia appendiculata TaxID=2587402 RepID=A0AAN6U389_9PEZI|nr:hypothetical protein N657DRAFT_273784 [Parathielavia appendiculata]